MEIWDRIALVTGAAAGAGRAIALRLGREGAAVVVADVDERGGQDTARAIQAGGARALFCRADITDDDDVARMLASARDWGGGLGILVNNAGGGGQIPPHYPEAAPAQWTATLDLNLRGPMLATQLALDDLRADGGAVVNVASTAGLGLAPYQSPEYGAAKAGLIRFTSTLTQLEGVRVNCIVPDWIATERAQVELAAMTAEERERSPTPVPLDDIGNAVVELVRDDTLAGRVVLLRGGEPRRLLPADGPP